ncbi:MAG: FAD-dependent oxidoreductase [Anaerolineae bacterium]
MTEEKESKGLNGENSLNTSKKGGRIMSTDEKEQKRITRREFVKGAAVGAAGVAAAGVLASCAQEATPCPTPSPCPPAPTAAPCPVPWLPEKWDKEADVVVVGFGGAGGAAALEAHDAGAKVIILEKTPTPGGATTLCCGVIYAAGTSVQKAEGITDTADEMYKYWMAMGKGLCDPELVRAVADQSGDTVEWLKKMGAVFYSGVGTPGVIGPWGLYYSGAEADPEFTALTPAKVRGHNVRPATPTWPYPPQFPPETPLTGGGGGTNPGETYRNGTGFFKCLYEGAKARGIEVLSETPAIALIADPVTKQVLGVRAQSKGTTLFIKATRAVVLATSGFTWNQQMLKLHNVDHGATIVPNSSSTPADVGEGIQMAMAIGADVANMDQGTTYGGPTPGAIFVNGGGRRFVDETIYGMYLAEVMRGQRGAVVYSIFDEDIRKEVGLTGTIQAPTIRELAVKIGIDPISQLGIDPAVLEDTVNTYNGYVQSGKDLEFGRTTKRHHAEPIPMVPIITPPFHALKVLPMVVLTQGGLRINSKAQVIDVSGNVIPRLYAAGLCSGGFIGDMYPGSGSAICTALNTGRIAGKNAGIEKL